MIKISQTTCEDNPTIEVTVRNLDYLLIFVPKNPYNHKQRANDTKFIQVLFIKLE